MPRKKQEQPSFGALLRASRTDAGLTQAELAQRIEAASQQAIARWERGPDLPRPEHVRTLARLFGWTGEQVAVAAGLVDPPGSASRREVSVPAALKADPRLMPEMQAVLLAAYRAAVKER